MGIISFIAFTLAVAIYAWWKTRGTDEKSADGYYLGGRSLGAITIAGSLLLTNLSAEQIVGLNGQAFSEGILVMAWETLAAIAMIITAIWLLPSYMKGGITTIPEYVEKRFDHQTKAILTALFLSGYALVLLPSVLYSGSLAFSTMFDIPGMLGISQRAAIWMCVWVIGLIGMVYAIFGGLKAVAVSDLVNAVGLLTGGLLIPVFGLIMVGDGSMIDGVNTLWEHNPDKFKVQGGPTASIPFGTIFTGMMLVQMFYWGTNQAILQRVFGAKSLKEGQKGMILAALIKFLIPVIVVLPGIIAWHLFDGNLANPDEAYPSLVRKVLPPAFVGFFAAVLFGAVLSSFNSVLNSSATLFGFDLYKQYFKKSANEQEAVKSGKIFGVIVGIFGMVLAPFILDAPNGLFARIQEFNGFYSIPILTVIVIGFFTKRVPPIAAKIGVISGSVLYLISQFAIKPILVANALEKATTSGITDENALSLIEAEAYPHFLHVMAILFVLNISIMLIIGKLYPRDSDYVQKITDDVDVTPWKYAFIAGAAITVLVISTYLIF
ncbi:solute:sodium symporter family transporter [Aquimarina sp. AD10]|uniref:solute:sodium symporter family transporter n=1 Tax=Aquimarina sp. AD10 TaxID=1714849 RepID=UPI000E4C5121|nr:solute:sodium symporter family transporter [Aquimarina sp. AD10]AXT62605.1 solute:sodium symporter family transporter [Aquimarina sp. AD10]RKM97789.1 solute:sodium symporter family transporter [Aquimarina sp. AD10]